MIEQVKVNLYDPGGVHRGDTNFLTTEKAAKEAQMILEPIGWLITIDYFLDDLESPPCLASLPLFDQS